MYIVCRYGQYRWSNSTGNIVPQIYEIRAHLIYMFNYTDFDDLKHWGLMEFVRYILWMCAATVE